MDMLHMLIHTIILRPYVFVPLMFSLVVSQRLLGHARTFRLFSITWAVAFLAEYSSTRTGIPFGKYFYTGSTAGKELYIANIPFFDSVSFPFMLFSSYCLALAFALPAVRIENTWCWVCDVTSRNSWSVLILTVIFFVLLDVVIDPVALKGDQWFLGDIYAYAHQGSYFGVPMTNFAGWAFVGSVSLLGLLFLE